MDWTEFGSKAIEHLVWPGVVLYVAHSQKAAIGALIRNVKKAKGPGGFELEVAETAKELKVQAQELVAKPVEPPILEAVPETGAELKGAGTAKAEGSATLTVGGPNTAPPDAYVWYRSYAFGRKDKVRDERLRASGSILEDWSVVEHTVRGIAMTHGLVKAYELPISRSVESLRSKRIISDETADLIDELLRLRNRVAHTVLEPTKEAAEDYTLSCRKVMTRMVSEEGAWEDVQKLAKDWDEQTKIKK